MKNIIFITIILLPFVSLAAGGIVPCWTEANPEECNLCDLAIGVKNIIDVILIDIVFPLSVIVFLYGGIKLITSRGSEGDLEKGKKALWMAFWGILIAFGAWLILDLILRNLVSEGFNWTWNEFPGCQ